MKNVRENQLKKCIFMVLEEFNSVIKTVFGEKFEVDFGLNGISVWSRSEGINDADIKEGLSKYFDVEVTSVHIDNYDRISVWICYKD